MNNSKGVGMGFGVGRRQDIRALQTESLSVLNLPPYRLAALSQVRWQKCLFFVYSSILNYFRSPERVTTLQ